jgi:hypothetical protein
MANPMVSIVIVTWNSWEYLPACLDSIFSQREVDKEVLVIDNDSGDGSAEKLSKSYPQVKSIANTRNSGYAKACNQGMKEAKGEFILLLNPDTVLRAGSLTKMIAFMTQNPEMGALGPQLLNLDGTVQPSCRRFPTYTTLLWEFTGLSRLFPKHPVLGSWRMGDFDFQKEREVDQPMASALLIRKRVKEDVGLMDERFPMFFNDVDYCRRIKQANFEIVYFPEAKVFHHLGGSTRKRKATMIIYSHGGFFQYLEKYHSRGLDRLLLLLSGIVLTLTGLMRIIFLPFGTILGKR